MIPFHECWEWIGTIDPSGYGRLRAKRNEASLSAHRISYQFHFGIIPKGMFVCHKCDNRSCVRPQHLFLGTTQENTQDRQIKNRQARGEVQWLSKLKEVDVLNIREKVEAGYSQKDMKLKYKVHRKTISDIVWRRTWKHI